MKEENVVLVDRNDNPIGTMPKIEAHEKALLHRAFSIFILNKKGQLMLQRRALDKYHSPGLWTNTCCSHPREGESNIEAGKRRLKEEIEINLQKQEIKYGNKVARFELDAFKKKCLMEGLDDIALSMEKISKIDDYEKRLRKTKPWVLNNA